MAQENQTPQQVEPSFEVEYMSRWKLIVRAFKKHKTGRIALVILVIFYALSIFADFFSPVNPYVQNTDRTYAPPSEVLWRVDGKFVGPYIYDVASYRDPVTYQRYYEPASVIQEITGEDTDGNAFSFSLDDPKIQNIFTRFESEIIAVGTEGERTLTKSSKEMKLVPISKKEILRQGGIDTVYNSPEDLEVYLNNPIYSYKMNRIGQLTEIHVDEGIRALNIEFTDGSKKTVEVGSIDDFSFKIFKIKLFNRGWEYKLFGLIPTNLHLFGVDSPAQYYLFGADAYGRDVWTRILFGSRISLSVGFAGILITFTLGLLLGGVAGYYGGWTDETLMRITEILMSIPGLYLLISLRAILPQDLPSHITYLMIIVILSFIGWPGMSRVIRGMVLSIKQTEYVEAARAMGYPTRRIIWRHIIPNTSTYVIVSATLAIPGYILGEAGLSFLGFGIREPQSSWGLMLTQAQKLSVLEQYPWLLLPGVFLFFAILAFNLFGDAVRDAFDPKGLGN
ncbi:MAG TPA: ABC transporter permease [Thermotogota bacterium]|nr:ABC transporter permease [Thermotogota bacterium]HRW92675.1 ABC transporter permease [Thermotogota bacterium]